MISTSIKTGNESAELKRLWITLKFTYGLVPIIAGADKFTNILVDWSKYLHPDLVTLLPFNASTFMIIVGVIEIVAGILVLTRTELGAYVVAAWLAGIAFSLIISWNFADVAVRDLVMAIGAVTLARLTAIKNRQ
jgi:uncharacterized membrane protein YphA (DoxX/SURF4 family)